MNYYDPEKLKREIEKRTKQLDRLCKNKISVKTINNKKEIIFEDGQKFIISGPIAENWPVTSYEKKKIGLFF